MTNLHIEKAIHTICNEDNVSDEYRSCLMVLIQNAMRHSIASEDINDLLNLIPVEESMDEG